MSYSQQLMTKLASMDDATARRYLISKTAHDTALLIKEAGMFDRLLGKQKPAGPASTGITNPNFNPSKNLENARSSEMEGVQDAVEGLRTSIGDIVNMLNETGPKAQQYLQVTRTRDQLARDTQQNEQDLQTSATDVREHMRRVIDSLKKLQSSQGGVGRISGLAAKVLQDFRAIQSKNMSVNSLTQWAQQTAQLLGSNQQTFDKRPAGTSMEGKQNYQNMTDDYQPMQGDPALKDTLNPNLGTKVETLPSGQFKARPGMGKRMNVVGKFYKASSSKWGWKLA